MGGDYRPEPAWLQGALGADLNLDRKTGTWKVVRIPRGDSWDEKKNSPLAAPGLNLREGDEILAVGGAQVGRDAAPYERLVNLAGQDVQLTVRSPEVRPLKGGKKARAKRATEGGIRVVTVRALREEYGLRYRDWVERNREAVHRRTNGRVGYVHIPDMGSFGFSEFHRYYLSEVDYDGLIIDVRHNGGGNVSQLLLGKLVQKRIGYDANRWGRPEPYPTDAPMGAMIALTDEYAGSDGDIFSHCFKLYGLGPLVGKRTWGGVVGIWPRHALVDGTYTSQPEFAFWFKDVGWGVENYGTDPDIEVEITPQDHAAGRDPQMDRGIEEIQRLLRKSPAKRPEFKNRPRLASGRLPAAR
jgi:tricorn protease